MFQAQNELHFQFLGIMKLSAAGNVAVLVAAAIILLFLAIWAFAMARHQARLDFEEEQKARREALSEHQEEVADKNIFGD